MDPNNSHHHNRTNKKSRTYHKKTRIHRVDAYFDSKEEGDFTLIVNKNGELEIHDSNGQKIKREAVKSQLFYERESKPKVLSYSDSQCPAFSNASLILRNFDCLCVIDTNTRKIRDRIISVSFACLGLWSNAEEYTSFRFWPELFIDSMDYKEKPERFAWYKVIELIKNGPDYDGQKTFGIIVDSELGEISAINSRDVPLYQNYYLPSQIQLVFASSDKSDTVQNIMMKECDKLATARLDRFEEVHKSNDSLDKFPLNYINIRKIA